MDAVMPEEDAISKKASGEMSPSPNLPRDVETNLAKEAQLNGADPGAILTDNKHRKISLKYPELSRQEKSHFHCAGKLLQDLSAQLKSQK